MFWIYVGVSLAIYLCIILLSIMYYWIKNSHNKPVLYEKDGMILVGIYDSSIRMKRYREFSFVQNQGKYLLSREGRREFIKGIVYGNVWALLFLSIPTVTVFVLEDARIALPGLIVAIASIITISLVTEMYQYIKCKNFLNKHRNRKQRKSSMEYEIQGKRLVWDYDELNNDASKFKNDNLYIAGIWNMKDTVGYTDTCVGVSILTEDCFYFATFCGIGFTMKVVGNNVECIKKQITK